MDELDHKILKILTKNAKISWKKIREKVHMIGQAVGMVF
ncbi:AsnC family protein [Neobacillus terrae]|nr:AsnC family protein [Neobacillus terrae]NHM33964.1 AsnC family protein [Neobacillus terrae]